MTQAKKGLDGVSLGESRLSLVNGTEGKLVYAGYKIEDLAASALYEEIVYLLWNGRLPNAVEFETLRYALATQAVVPSEVLAAMKLYPKDANPMAVLRTTTSMLAFYDADSEDTSIEAQKRKAVRMTGQVTTLCAAWSRIRKGEEPVAPRQDLTLAANFMYMLTNAAPEKTAVDVMNAYMVLLTEHSMNASTFASRVATSTGADMHSAIVAAMGTLKGPSHGGANEEAMRMFLEIGEVENVEPWFTKYIKSGERRIMGIGHRVYKALDPRAAVLRERAKALAEASGNTKWFLIADNLAELARADQYFIERNLYPNVDYFSAIALSTIHIEVDMFTPLFALSRMAGWTAHIIEQQQDNRLIRPTADYVGPMGLEWVPMDQRA